MAFGFDDAALAAAKEALSETAKEVAKEVRDETIQSLASKPSFSPSDFNVSSNAMEKGKPERKGIDNSTSPEISKEDRFAPDRFNEIHGESNVSEAVPNNIERTSTFEEQTIDNFKLEEMRPEINDRLNLGQEHDGAVLRNNLQEVTGQNPEASNAHHIVGNATKEAAEILDKYGIDRNDPANGIFLPDSKESMLKGSIHGPGTHTETYYNEVNQRFIGVSSREEALEVLQSLKEDLYSGKLPLHNNMQPNT